MVTLHTLLSQAEWLHAAQMQLRVQGPFWHLLQDYRSPPTLLVCLLWHVRFRGSSSCLSNRPIHDSIPTFANSPRTVWNIRVYYLYRNHNKINSYAHSLIFPKQSWQCVCITARNTWQWLKRLPKTLSKAQVFWQSNEFENGRKAIEDTEWSGHPLWSGFDENVPKVKGLFHFNHRLRVISIAEDLNMWKTTVHKIISQNSNMWKVCAKLVPRCWVMNKSIRWFIFGVSCLKTSYNYERRRSGGLWKFWLPAVL